MSLSLDSTLYVRFFWLQPSKSSTPSNPLTAGSPQNARLEDDCPFQVGDFLSSMLNFPVGVYKWSEKKKIFRPFVLFPKDSWPNQSKLQTMPFFWGGFCSKRFFVCPSDNPPPKRAKMRHATKVTLKAKLSKSGLDRRSKAVGWLAWHVMEPMTSWGWGEGRWMMSFS